jgi:hypothetical protein
VRVIIPLQPLTPPEAPGGEGAGPAGEAPKRFGRRALVITAGAVIAVVAVVVAVATAASGGGDSGGKDKAAPSAPASQRQAPATVPSAPATSSASATPSATATTTAPTTPPSPTLSPSTAAAPPATAVSSPTADPVTTVPSPPDRGKGAAGPKVQSVRVTQSGCGTGSRPTATATVVVNYDGTAAGTLRLTWWQGASPSPQGAVSRPTQTAHFPKGSHSYTLTDTFTFTPDTAHPYVGLSMATTPGAAAGNGSFALVCH